MFYLYEEPGWQKSIFKQILHQTIEFKGKVSQIIT